MSELEANPGLNPEELVLRYMEAPRADLKDLIMVACAGMVERIARRFSGIEPHEDLVQVGFIGLLNALGKFDPNAGVKFNTYATHLVAGEIKHYLRDRTQTIRQPAWLQEMRTKVNRSAGRLQAELGRPATEGEIAADLGIAESAVREVHQTAELLKLSSLDATQPGDDENPEVDHLDAADFCPEQLSVEERLVLDKAMAQLRDLEREVLMLFHFDSLNQTEIAHRLGISCNYVSHILRQSLAKLRKILHTEEEKDRILQRQAEVLEDDVVDAITGVYTEEYLRARLGEELHRAGAEDTVLALVLIEFRGLRNLQGFYGEASVRDFLVDAADFLKNSVRRLDIVTRWSEAGFAIMLPSTGPSVAVVERRLNERFQPWLNNHRSPEGAVTVAIGTAVFPDDAKNVKTMLEKARPVADGRRVELGVVEADERNFGSQAA